MKVQDSSNHYSQSQVEPMDPTELLLKRAVLRLNASILGSVLGIVTGLGIFLATNFLILKGGKVVGPHLALLSNFFPFYSVTFIGSVIGLGYGLLTGYLAGFFIATVYNLVVKLKGR